MEYIEGFTSIKKIQKFHLFSTVNIAVARFSNVGRLNRADIYFKSFAFAIQLL